jgi:hypothetical protein
VWRWKWISINHVWWVFCFWRRFVSSFQSFLFISFLDTLWVSRGRNFCQVITIAVHVYSVCKSCVNVNHLCLHTQTFATYTYVVGGDYFLSIYMVSCKCFRACKCIYYISLIVISSCSSIEFTSQCGCIPKLNVLLSMGHFDWPFTKNYDVFNTLKIDFINMKLCFPLPSHIYYKNELLGKGYGTIVVLF